MESRSFETVSIYTPGVCVLPFAGDWMEIYIISTLRVSVSDLVARNKERWGNM